MAFGVTTDWFGKASAGTKELQSSDHSASYAVDATAENSDGDVACRTKAGETNEYSVTYKHCGEATGVSIDSAWGKVGELISGIQITGIDVSTDGKDFPSITMKGVEHPSGAATPSTYSSGVTYDAIKKAQGFGATASNGNIISSTVSISGSMAIVEDADGDIKCREPYGVQIKGSNTVQACSGAPAGSASAGYTLDAPIGRSESNTGYDTANIEVFKDLLKG